MTVESARRALALWLDARRTGKKFLVAGDAARGNSWREELNWLGLEAETASEATPRPEWLANFPPLEPAPPSPWGEWSGQTRLAELRELGVLPEALTNFLASTLLELPAESGELVACEDLPALWSPEKLPTAPVRFDFEQLRRLNHEIGRASCRERV